jgi:hypothetical protein
MDPLSAGHRSLGIRGAHSWNHWSDGTAWECFFSVQCSTISEGALVCQKVPSLRSSYVKHGGMTLTEANWSFRWGTCPSYTLSTTNPNGVDPRFRGERPATNCLLDEIAWRLKLIFITYKDSVQTSRKERSFHLKLYSCVLCKEPIAAHGANQKNRLATSNNVRNRVLVLNLAIYTGVSKKLRQLSGVSSRRKNSGNVSYLCISTNI